MKRAKNMALDFMYVQNKLWSESTSYTLPLFRQTVIYFRACTRFRGWHEVSRIAINALDISCSYHCVDGPSYTTDTGLSVCVGLDYKECNVFTSINPVLHYAWLAEQRVKSKSGICTFVWVESVRRQDEILMFLDMKYKDLIFPQAKDGNLKNWRGFSAWRSGTCKQLNYNSSGKRPLYVYVTYSGTCFQNNSIMFLKQVQKNKFTHFLTLRRIYVARMQGKIVAWR